MRTTTIHEATLHLAKGLAVLKKTFEFLHNFLRANPVKRDDYKSKF